MLLSEECDFYPERFEVLLLNQNDQIIEGIGDTCVSAVYNVTAVYWNPAPPFLFG